MPSLNERAHELCNAMAADAEQLGIAVSTLPCGTRLIDCGVNAPGSKEAGRRLAEVCMAGLGRVQFMAASPEILNVEGVQVNTNRPVAACMASQYAGWEVKGDKFFAMGSGPMRAAACREELFKDIGYCETPDLCVGVLETSKLPPEGACVAIAEKCNVSPERLTLCVARTSSPAGTVQIVARSIETALHKMHLLGFDLSQIMEGRGNAPLPPLCDDDLMAIGRTNDAILYGTWTHLDVDCDDETITQIGERIPSCASSDYGRPFAKIFASYNNDFYRIDPMLFSPAGITFTNIRTGISRQFGKPNLEVLAESFGLN